MTEGPPHCRDSKTTGSKFFSLLGLLEKAVNYTWAVLDVINLPQDIASFATSLPRLCPVSSMS